MRRIDPLAAGDVARRRFLYLWMRRLSSPVALALVADLLNDPRSASLARSWIEGDRVDQAERTDRERHALRSLRDGLRGYSSLLARVCDHEGLSLAAVAHGILPEAHVLDATEGFSWTLPGDDAESVARWRSTTQRTSDRWERGYYRVGAFVRPRSHAAGRWAVRQVRGVVHTHLELGGATLRSHGAGAWIDVPQMLPDTVMAALPGRRLSVVLDHPVLAAPDFEIMGVVERKKGIRIRFACPVVPAAFDDLRPEPGREHQQLGRDGTLSGSAAMSDVLRRGVGAFRSLPPELLANVHRLGLLGGAEDERMRRIDLMAPPWAERLAQGS